MPRILAFGLLIAAVAVAAPIPETGLAQAQRVLSQGISPAIAVRPETVAVYLDRLREQKIDIELDREAFRKAGVTDLDRLHPGKGVCAKSSLHRLLRRVAWNLHPTGMIGLAEGKVTLTTRTRLAARGGQIIPFALKGWEPEVRKRTEALLDLAVDIDFSDIDPKDLRKGEALRVLAQRCKVDIDFREDVFTRIGKPDAWFAVEISSERDSLRGMISKTIRPIKVRGDELLLLVADDGAIVVTTKKYKDGNR
jgi:hypothetical protein